MTIILITARPSRFRPHVFNPFQITDTPCLRYAIQALDFAKRLRSLTLLFLDYLVRDIYVESEAVVSLPTALAHKRELLCQKVSPTIHNLIEFHLRAVIIQTGYLERLIDKVGIPRTLRTINVYFYRTQCSFLLVFLFKTVKLRSLPIFLILPLQ